MGLSTVYVGIMIISFGINFASGLQCPTCTYFMPDDNMHTAKRSIASEIFDYFDDKTCAFTGNSLQTIQLDECLNIPGKTSYCSFMKGEITLRIPLVVLRDVDVKLQVFNRGCFYSPSNKLSSNGCRKRRSNIHEASFIEQIVNRELVPTEIFKALQFDGETCLCADMYCKEISSASKSNPCTFMYIKTLLQLSMISVILKFISGSF
ncbi:hypothetical protein ACF0H5_019277 [Mactra antiquata]